MDGALGNVGYLSNLYISMDTPMLLNYNYACSVYNISRGEIWRSVNGVALINEY